MKKVLFSMLFVFALSIAAFAGTGYTSMTTSASGEVESGATSGRIISFTIDDVTSAAEQVLIMDGTTVLRTVTPVAGTVVDMSEYKIVTGANVDWQKNTGTGAFKIKTPWLQ